jgi:hypothetical protein
MSEELNKNIRDFFIKIGEDIKTAFEDCCPCCCINRSRIHPRDISDIENQVTEDMNSIDKSSHVIVQINNDEKDEEDLKVEHFILEDNVIVRKNKVSYYYDCKEYYGDGTETETKCVDSDSNEDDFVIIY